MNAPVFIGREQELGRLRKLLDQTLTGSSRVAFLTGEAGSGKTTLIHEFARLAEANHANLIVATGNCNAQTGQGDPYLPLIEVLQLLSGDVEANLSKNVVDTENARRLKGLLAHSSQVLVEVGPDLAELLLAAVPGAGLAAKAGSIFAKKAGLLDSLEKVGKKKDGAAALDTTVDQNRIFEQYAGVLKALAARQPILIILDDLQWADDGSINLLFHLARRLEKSPILILGTFRPDEVALGRGDQRHPLEKVLAELKRYYGDIVVDLGQAREKEGRRFVDALLDTEPNALSEQFREALFQHTEGHPLFIVELLQEMKDNGDLVKDEQGRWVESARLVWNDLPARVEGVIEERINRLADDQREILSVASVEGTDFTAQVVARVQDIKERPLLQTLSRDLEDRHHLVREAGEVRAGRQLLFRYQFTHALFQQYLYEGLSGGERRLLHGEIAAVLEELYAGHIADITVRLARHYAEAGDVEKAVDYLRQAGERARMLYANSEAIDLFMRAVALIEEDPAAYDFEQHHEVVDQLYEGLGDVLELTGRHEQAREVFQTALQHVQDHDQICQARLYRKTGKTWEPQREYAQANAAYERAEQILGPPPGDSADKWWQEWVQIQLLRMWILHWRGQWQQMNPFLDKVRPAVERHGTPAQRSKFFTALVLMAFGRDRYRVSDETLANALAALTAIQEAGTPSEIALTRVIAGLAHLWRRELDAAEEQMQTALTLVERTGDITVQSRCLAYLAVVYRLRGQAEETRKYCERGMEVATQAQLLEDIGMARANLAWLALRAGNLAQAQEHGLAALALWRQLPLAMSTQWLALEPLTAVALAQGRIVDAVACARALLAPTQQRLPDNLAVPLAAAIQAWDAGDKTAARTTLIRVAQLAQQSGYL